MANPAEKGCFPDTLNLSEIRRYVDLQLEMLGITSVEKAIQDVEVDRVSTFRCLAVYVIADALGGRGQPGSEVTEDLVRDWQANAEIGPEQVYAFAEMAAGYTALRGLPGAGQNMVSRLEDIVDTVWPEDIGDAAGE